MVTADDLRKIANPSRYAILLFLSVGVILVSIYCLMNGLHQIFPLLYYPPIILAAYWFLKKGVIYAGILGLLYLSFVIFFTRGNTLNAIAALAHISIFLILSALVIVFSMKIIDQRQSIEQSELKFRTIWEYIETGIILVDADTHLILAVNPEAERLTGYKEEKMVGRSCHQFICPAERGKCPISDLNQRVDHAERILLTRNGTPMMVVKTVTQAVIEGRNVYIESFVPVNPHTLIRDTKK